MRVQFTRQVGRTNPETFLRLLVSEQGQRPLTCPKLLAVAPAKMLGQRHQPVAIPVDHPVTHILPLLHPTLECLRSGAWNIDTAFSALQQIILHQARHSHTQGRRLDPEQCRRIDKSANRLGRIRRTAHQGQDKRAR